MFLSGDQSNEVELVLELLTQLLILQDLTVELCTFVSVLEDTRDLDRASPVDVVETL